jgi:hypothetical protein
MIGKRIANLIGLRTLITLSITGALIYGFAVGKVSNEQFMTIATMIFTFYFAKKEQETKEAEETNKEETKEIGRYG